MAQIGFNVGDYEPGGEFEPLAPGRYTVEITSTEERQAKNGGNYVAIEFAVVAGEFKGRKIFENLCIVNANPTAQKIAREKLSAICHACGVLNPRDTIELHEIAIDALVGVRVYNDSKQNFIKAYYKHERITKPATEQQSEKSPWD